MASSSSIPSSSTTSAASTSLGVAPGASAPAAPRAPAPPPSTALGVAPGASAPDARVLPTRAPAPPPSTALGVAPGASAYISQMLESGWETTAPPTSTSAPVMFSEEGSSSSASAPFTSSRTVASTPSSYRTSGSAAAVDTSARTAWRCPPPSGLPPPVLSYKTEWPRLGTVAKEEGGSSQNSAGVVVSPTKPHAPVMRSCEEGSSSSPSAAFPSSSPTDTRPASAASSTTTPSGNITLVPSASGSAPAMETSAHTSSSAPGVKISDPAREAHALSSAFTSAPSIVDASTSSSALGVTTSAHTSTGGRGREDRSRGYYLEDWVPEHFPSSITTPSRDSTLVASAPGSAPAVETSARTAPGPGAATNASGAPWIIPVAEHAFGGNGIDMSAAPPPLYPDPMWTYRREEVMPRVPAVLLCSDCGRLPALFRATPCGHLAICAGCYATRFVCPCCGELVVHWLWPV